MTKREFLEMVIAESANEEVKAFAQNEVVKMDERNARRSASPSKKAIENEPIKANIVKFLGGHYEDVLTAAEIAAEVGISTQKASALLRQIDGLTVTEVKVKGKGKVKGYSLA